LDNQINGSGTGLSTISSGGLDPVFFKNPGSLDMFDSLKLSQYNQSNAAKDNANLTNMMSTGRPAAQNDFAQYEGIQQQIASTQQLMAIEATLHGERTTRYKELQEQMSKLTDPTGINAEIEAWAKGVSTLDSLSGSVETLAGAMETLGGAGSAASKGMRAMAIATSMTSAIAIMISKLKTTTSVWETIAATIAGTAAVVSMGAQFKSMNDKFATGGIAKAAPVGDQTTFRMIL
jgi:hypothetical protein